MITYIKNENGDRATRFTHDTPYEFYRKYALPIADYYDLSEEPDAYELDDFYEND